MASYAARVKADTARWVEAGLIDAVTAEQIGRDVESHDRRALSFGFVLGVMAALLLGAAILLLVAANWEAIPRLLRVGGLFALIAVGYVGGAMLKVQGRTAAAEAFWLVAVAAFGGSIAAIGQMYHLPGTESGAVLTWCLGTMAAAAALRSAPLTIIASAIAAIWLVLRVFELWDSRFPFGFLYLAAALWAVSLWSGSRRTRDLVLLSIVAYFALVAAYFESRGIAGLLAAGSAILFAFAVYFPSSIDRVMRLDGRTALHCLIGFLAGIILTQLDLIARVDDLTWFIVATAIAFGGIAATLVLAGRTSRGLRWVAYLGFAFEICLIYSVMMGTMLGTAGFFLAAGTMLALLAFAIARIERRINADNPAAEGAAL